MNTDQAPEQSMADRIASQFDEQPEAAEPEQPEAEASADAAESEQAPEFVEVEVDGELYQLPPKLKDKVLANADYTKKTQEVAEQRRLVEVREQQIKAAELERTFQKSVNDDITAMQRLDFQIEQYKAVDATGMNSEQLWQLSRHIEKLKDERETLSKKVSAKYGEFQQEQQRLGQEMMTKAQEAAAKAVPNWSPETQKQIKDYALAQGFEEQELKTITDPRVVKVLWQASQYVKAQQTNLKGKVTTIPSVKPGSSNPMSQATKDKLAFNKQMKSAPNSAAKAKLIERELMSRF